MYRWSSYQADAEGEENSLISPQQQYLDLHPDHVTRRAAYRKLIDAHMDADSENAIRAATQGNIVPGNSRFQAESEAVLKRRVTRGEPGRPGKGSGA